MALSRSLSSVRAASRGPVHCRSALRTAVPGAAPSRWRRAPIMTASPAARRMTTIGEFELIERWFTRAPRRAALGVGDDCALIAPAPGHELTVSTDLLIEGRHFLSTVDPERLGHKALAVNLSDLAACGASPLAYTLALALP